MSPQSLESEKDVNKSSSQELQNGISKKLSVPKKVYVHRNSVLTDLMQVSHLQTVYNISVAVFTLLVLNACIYYIAAPQKLWQDVSIITWAASDPAFFVQMWLSFHGYALCVFLGFKTWMRLRNHHTKWMDSLFLVLSLHVFCFMFVGTAFAVLKRTARPITHFAIMCEQVRIFMKLYSFIRECTPRVLQHDSEKDGKQEQFLCPRIKHFFYFLFAPVLIYRDSYPRKEGISWPFVLNQLFQFFACIFITYCIFLRFVVDGFRDTGHQPFQLPHAALLFGGCMLVGSLMMFLMFYGLLHSWLNVFAELLQFADREFYQDWWNSTSFSQYYRRWNTVVYDWLYAYIYVESHKMGINRSVSMLLVFFVSALVHEYIIALSMGYFYPVLMVTYLTIGLIVIFITKKRTTQFWNTFMWSMLFSGWGVVVCLYALEWYARNNCYTPKDPGAKFFIPASWNSSCHILSYS